MTKEPPILVVNKPQKNNARKNVRKRKAPVKPSSAGKKQKQSDRKESNNKELPQGLYYIAMGVVGVIFATVFYCFFIRPYTYRWKPCYGTKAYGVCLPHGYGVHGLDISHHQGNIDWKELQKSQFAPFPIRFIFIKSSEGGDFSDTAFQKNFEAARKHGFIRGAYHFYNPKTDASRQADFFIRSVNLEPGDLPPVLDIEIKGDDDKKLKKDLKIWLDKIENHYRVKPILYTSYKFKTRYLNDSLFNSYPYWIAHYYVDSVEYKGEWKFWQHTDAGKMPGIRGNVDLNVFNGSNEQLDSLTIPQEKPAKEQ